MWVMRRFITQYVYYTGMHEEHWTHFAKLNETNKKGILSHN